MPIFKPKSGPVLSRSRFWHFALALAITAGAGHFGGYEASVYSGAGIIVVGFGWEVSNRFTKGYHPFGDAIDFWSFVAGAFVAGLTMALTQ